MTTSSQFEMHVHQLAEAEAVSRYKSADATQARAAKSAAAVNLITTAHLQVVDPDELRETLLDAGILKGTVSKIVTVIYGLGTSLITLDDVKSLNGAYNAVKAAEAAAKAMLSAFSSPGGETLEAVPSSFITVTPDDALNIILHSIQKAGDADAVYRAAGDWIDKITNAISAVTRKVGGDDE